MARNPYFDGTPAEARRAVEEYLLRLVRSHLEARHDEAVILDAQLRALHPLLAVPAVWARVVQALGL